MGSFLGFETKGHVTKEKKRNLSQPFAAKKVDKISL